MRRKIIAGNWKMHKTVREAEELVGSVLSGLPDTPYEVVVCPPFTALYRVSQLLKGSRLKLGAQNMHYELQGAFTGEISAPMLKELDVVYVIIGHSERRHIFGESNDVIAKKLKRAVETGLKPILCVGEKLEEREGGLTEEVIGRQLNSALEGLSREDLGDLVIAYEPVWAIGTGRNATPQQAQEVHAFIRHRLSELYGDEFADSRTILYGGSVKPHNILELTKERDVDGALVGGASLSAESFLEIVEKAHK